MYIIDQLEDLDTIDFLCNGGNIAQVSWINDYVNRRIRFVDDIDPESVMDAVVAIQNINRHDNDMNIPPDKRKPIIMYLNSPGGDIDAGFTLIDTIIGSQTPVYTVNNGFQYSMGCLVGIAGHKRFATKHAKFLLHDGSGVVYNSMSKMQDIAEFNKKVAQEVKDYILERTKIDSDTYDKYLRVEWYMTAEEAKENGLVDYIVDEDCPYVSIL